VKRYERRHNRMNGEPEVISRHRFAWAARWLSAYNCVTHGCYVVDTKTRERIPL